MEGRLYQTQFSKKFGVLLKPTATATNVEVYCLAYDAQTEERRQDHDGYYFISSLYIVEFGEGEAA